MEKELLRAFFNGGMRPVHFMQVMEEGEPTHGATPGTVYPREGKWFVVIEVSEGRMVSYETKLSEWGYDYDELMRVINRLKTHGHLIDSTSDAVDISLSGIDRLDYLNGKVRYWLKHNWFPVVIALITVTASIVGPIVAVIL